ncbi:amino acid transporter [Aureobasidium sp. EXF-12298]|nr:amino acid transporter [Aureobasidium sp. EXF-12298]KAI4764561.1 amino acid transporter [Aureobasidium sp. EXF-12344]KAI4782195.1 amino acid transporter [Aureobasidium sp. EXF-3400]
MELLKNEPQANATAHPDSVSTFEHDLRGSSSEPKVGELLPGEAELGGLGRHLGLWSTVALIVGRIIGTGIFSTPSSIVSSVGSVGAAFMLWLLGFASCLSGLCIWLELGCMIPRSGGEKVYLEAAYKRPKLLATTFFAWQAIILGFTASGCIVFASYVIKAAGRTATEWEKRGIALAVVTVICAAHTVVPRWAVRGMNGLVIVKLVVLVFIVVAGWAVLGGAAKDRIPHPTASFHDAFAGTTSSGYLWATALFKVLNSYAGWSNAAYVLNEVKNPVRTLKIAGPLGLGICGVLYMMANVSYFAAATPKEVAASKLTVAALFMNKVFGTAAEKAISVLIAISAFGNVMTVTFAQARVNQELAKEGVIPFPRFWASSWPAGAPGAGLLLHWIPSAIIIVAIPFGDAYNFILDVEGYPGSVINFFVVVGIANLIHTMAAEDNPEKQFASMLGRLHANGAYSDLKIVCGSDTYLVHKAIVCPQSDFFRAACRPDTFAEGRTGVINIPASSGRPNAFYDQPFNAEEFDWDLDVETTESVKIMIHYFYHHDYLERETAKLQFYSDKCRNGMLAEHSRMYAMGEKYGVPGLKALAIAKVQKAFVRIHHAGLAAATIIAYKSTPETDRGLRAAVLNALDCCRRLYDDNEELQQIIFRISEISYGLYRRMIERETPGRN